MREEDILLALAFSIAVYALGLWFYQDEIKAIWYWMDTRMLAALQYIPFVGDHYGKMLRDYQAIESHWPSYLQYLSVGQGVWRPFAVLVFLPMCLRWAWKAHKKRAAQGFDEINQSYIDKHYRTLTPSPATRQQWTVRHWFHHYGLHKLKWGSQEWEEKLCNAFMFQLGPPSDTPESRELLLEFAKVIKKELVTSFGHKTVAAFDPADVVERAVACHAYRTPAMVRILAAARDDFGVVSPYAIRNRLFESADLIPIWFSLNGLGRQTTHIESQGALSHFYIEVAYNERLEEPQFRNAIKGLDQYREHLLEQLRMPDLDESAQYNKEENPGEDEPRYDYSLTPEEETEVAARS